MMYGLRPTRSEVRPATVRPTALPAANTASAVPATSDWWVSRVAWSRLWSTMTAAAKRGRIALRTPKLAQPLAKAEPTAAR